MGHAMSKYARLLWRHNDTDQTIHLVDVLDMEDRAYQPRPLLGCMTDQDLLSRLFEPNKAQWLADDEWFVAVPQGAQSGAVFIGAWPDDQNDPKKYENPDGTYADGSEIPSP